MRRIGRPCIAQVRSANRMLQDLVHAQYRRDAAIRSGEYLLPVRKRLARKDPLEFRAHGACVRPCDFLAILPVTRGEIRPSEDLAKSDPEFRFERSHREITAVPGPVEPVARHSTVQEVPSRTIALGACAGVTQPE